MTVHKSFWEIHKKSRRSNNNSNKNENNQVLYTFTVVNTNAEINFLKKVLNNVPDIVFLDHN